MVKEYIKKEIDYYNKRKKELKLERQQKKEKEIEKKILQRMKDIKKEQDSIYEKIKEKAEIMRLKQNIEKYLRGITEIYDKDVLKKITEFISYKRNSFTIGNSFGGTYLFKRDIYLNKVTMLGNIDIYVSDKNINSYILEYINGDCSGIAVKSYPNSSNFEYFYKIKFSVLANSFIDLTKNKFGDIFREHCISNPEILNTLIQDELIIELGDDWQTLYITETDLFKSEYNGKVYQVNKIISNSFFTELYKENLLLKKEIYSIHNYEDDEWSVYKIGFEKKI